MKEQSHVAKNVEQLFSEFFATGEHDGKMHTLQLDGSISETDELKLEPALAALPDVEGVHVDSQNNNVYVIFSGTVQPLVEAVTKAGYTVKTAH
jgi:hypothetical protein